MVRYNLTVIGLLRLHNRSTDHSYIHSCINLNARNIHCSYTIVFLEFIDFNSNFFFFVFQQIDRVSPPSYAQTGTGGLGVAGRNIIRCVRVEQTRFTASSCHPPIHRGPVGRTGIAGDHRTAGRAARSLAVVAAVALTIVFGDCRDWRTRRARAPARRRPRPIRCRSSSRSRPTTVVFRRGDDGARPRRWWYTQWLAVVIPPCRRAGHHAVRAVRAVRFAATAVMVQ